MRAVSVAFSLDLPSRRKNEPGILPAAYIRSSMSTVRGRKSTSRRLPTVAVHRTMVSPAWTTTGPPGWRPFAFRTLVLFHRREYRRRDVPGVMHLCGPLSPGTSLKDRGGAGYAGADSGFEIAADSSGHLLQAPVRLESLEVEAEPLRPLPEVGAVDMTAVGVEGVDHLDEAALHS